MTMTLAEMDAQTVLETAGVLLGIAGALAMSVQRYRAASILWIVSNALLIALALSAGLSTLALMYCVYGVLAVVSLVNLRRADRKASSLNITYGHQRQNN